MKKLILVCLFLLGISAVGFAQAGNTPADKAARLKTALTLTDDQAVKVTAIYANQDRRTDSLKAHDNGDIGAMTKKLQASAIFAPERATPERNARSTFCALRS